MGEAKRKRIQSRLTHADIGKAVLTHLEKTVEKSAPEVLVIDHPVSNTPRHYAHISSPKGYLTDLDALQDRPHTKTYTPAAEWREKGEPDPHAGVYDGKERHEIMGGQFTDDEIAYKCGMASGRDLESISTLHMAKDRIRWLSRKLVAAEKRIAELEGKK